MSLCNKVTSSMNDFTQKFFCWPSVVSLTSDPFQTGGWPDGTDNATNQINIRYLVFLKLFFKSSSFYFAQKTVELKDIKVPVSAGPGVGLLDWINCDLLR